MRVYCLLLCIAGNYGLPFTLIDNVVDVGERTGELVSHWTEESGVNPEELGSLLEGDILHVDSRNGLGNPDTRWPNGVVYYRLSPAFSKEDVRVIREAMAQYEHHTCVRFAPASRESPDYVQVPGCTHGAGTVMHEMMHTLGFLHEHSRHDRDNYVTVRWENVQPGTEDNFQKAAEAQTTTFGVPYDYSSLMHYSSNAFSANGRPTIVPRDLHAKVGQRNGFSRGDLLKINSMYKCNRTSGNDGGQSVVGTIIDNISSFFG